jgi:hypothetical protein
MIFRIQGNRKHKALQLIISLRVVEVLNEPLTFLSVPSHMLLKRSSLREILMTQLALERPMPGMRLGKKDIPSQPKFPAEEDGNKIAPGDAYKSSACY